MAFDACMMRAVLGEFSSEFPEAKIEKVLQPRNDEIDMVIHHGRSSRRLVFNVGPNAPRLQLSDKQKENPLKAPMFCIPSSMHACPQKRVFRSAKIIRLLWLFRAALSIGRMSPMNIWKRFSENGQAS